MNGKDEGLQLWIDFSQKSVKYVPGDCEDLWNGMEMRGKTIASLLAMAKMDSPYEYRDWKNTNIRNFLYESLGSKDPTEYDVARVIACMVGDRFKCANSLNNIWYEFRDHRWHKLDDHIVELSKIWVNDAIKKYYEFWAKLSANRSANADNEVLAAQCTSQMERIGKIITKLKTLEFCDGVIKMCKIEMHDGNFLLNVVLKSSKITDPIICS
jgi:hypothetical protein